MRKLLLLGVIPLLLVSCTKTTEDGQQEVSFATFCLHWKSEFICKQPNYATAHTIVEKDSSGWAYINNELENDVVPEDRHKEDNNTYFFSIYGTPTPDHEPITNNKPFSLTLDLLGQYAHYAPISKFYINPLRMVIEIVGSSQYNDTGDAIPYFWTIRAIYDYTFDDNMWLVKSTLTSFQGKEHGDDYGWISTYETNSYSMFY